MAHTSFTKTCGQQAKTVTSCKENCLFPIVCLLNRDFPDTGFLRP